MQKARVSVSNSLKEQPHDLLRCLRDSLRHPLPRTAHTCFASIGGELSRAEQALLLVLLGVLAGGQVVMLVAGGAVLRRVLEG